MHHTATHYTTLHHTATHRNTPQRTATHCKHTTARAGVSYDKSGMDEAIAKILNDSSLAAEVPVYVYVQINI